MNLLTSPRELKIVEKVLFGFINYLLYNLYHINKAEGILELDEEVNKETERAREEAALKALRAEAVELRKRAASLNSQVLISISQGSQGTDDPKTFLCIEKNELKRTFT